MRSNIRHKYPTSYTHAHVAVAVIHDGRLLSHTSTMPNTTHLVSTHFNKSHNLIHSHITSDTLPHSLCQTASCNTSLHIVLILSSFNPLFSEAISTPDTNAPSSTSPEYDDLYIPYIDKLGIRRRRRRLPSDPKVRRNGTTPITDSGKRKSDNRFHYSHNTN